MNTAPIVTQALSKRFGNILALQDLNLEIPEGSVTGLVGRNGSGKSTLMRLITGLYLASDGECRTLGQPADKLNSENLSRIGYLDQEARYLDWLTVRDHLDYVASFYPQWDKGLESRLLSELDLNQGTRVGAVSPGNRQKLGILLAVCHRPDLLLLDEPASALDPIVREQVLDFLMSLLVDSTRTIVVSSHILHDVERLVDQVVCIEQGRLLANLSLDELQEDYAEWRITARNGALPDTFPEAYVLEARVNGSQARLIVQSPRTVCDAFAANYDVDINERALTLEQIFPWLLKKAA